MRIHALPLVPELRNGPGLADGEEDRVVAESLVALRRACDGAVERPARAYLVAIRGEGDELADVPRPAVVLARQLLQQPRDAVDRPARGLDPGAPAEGVDLDPGVLARDPVVRRRVRAPVPRLDPSVREERLAVLDGLVRRVEELDLPVRQRRAQLAELVLVPRGENEPHGSGAAAAADCAPVRVPIPPDARSSSSSSSSREKGSRSAVACTSTRSPSPVMTTFMSVSAVESSS